MDININEKTSDELIVEMVRTKDKELYFYIIDRYESKLLAYIRRLTYNSPESEDLVQQTLVNTYVSINGFNTQNKFSSWIYRIAHNLAINWLKKKKASISLDEDEVTAGKLVDKIDIEKELINKEISKQITEAINKLPEKQKEPFILKYFEDMSYEEISDILRIPKNTVGTMIIRAKKKLKTELKKTYGQ